MAQDTEKLRAFITTAKGKGVDDDSLVALLRQNGWSERRIYEGLSDYYEQALGVPIPSKGARIESARDAFYYLLAFITLGCWTIALILFADLYVDHMIPDVSTVAYYDVGRYFREQVSGELATLMIAFPIFLFISRLIAREVQRRPEALESGVRKWLTYIALVITATTLIGDAVWFLTSFLTGDLTVRFAWKAGVLFVIALGVFSYYLGIVRSDKIETWRDRAFGIAATAAVLIALVLGFTTTGSPARVRLLVMDETRVDRISRIASTLYHCQYCRNSTTPPQTLQASNVDAQTIRDPETKDVFEYHPGPGTTYQLCATFNLASESSTSAWAHPAGHYCYALDTSMNEPKAPAK